MLQQPCALAGHEDCSRTIVGELGAFGVRLEFCLNFVNYSDKSKVNVGHGQLSIRVGQLGT